MIRELALRYLAELKEIIDEIPLDNIEKIIKVMINAYNHNRSLFIMGNGGSGATASHFACDINKGTSIGIRKRFKVMCLNDNIPTMLAYANDNSYEDIFVEQLKNFLTPQDIVIGISGSGNSENVIRAIHYANKKEGISIAFTGFNGGTLAKIAYTSIIVPACDMQKVEDAHLIVVHMVMQIITAKINAENNRLHDAFQIHLKR